MALRRCAASCWPRRRASTMRRVPGVGCCRCARSAVQLRAPAEPQCYRCTGLALALTATGSIAPARTQNIAPAVDCAALPGLLACAELYCPDYNLRRNSDGSISCVVRARRGTCMWCSSRCHPPAAHAAIHLACTATYAAAPPPHAGPAAVVARHRAARGSGRVLLRICVRLRLVSEQACWACVVSLLQEQQQQQSPAQRQCSTWLKRTL